MYTAGSKEKSTDSNRYRTYKPLSDARLDENGEDVTENDFIWDTAPQSFLSKTTKLLSKVIASMILALLIFVIETGTRALMAFATVFGGLVAFYLVTKWSGNEIFTIEVHQVAQPLQKLVSNMYSLASNHMASY